LKSKLIYLILVIAGFLVLFYIFREAAPSGRRDTSFAVKPGTVITRIEMYQGDKRLTLSLDEGIWMVNKTAEARKSAVRFLTEIIEGMKVKSPVSAEMFRSEVIEKGIEPVKVGVYSKRRLLKSFFVYGSGSNSYGNIMKIKPSSKPYIVYLPGFENSIGSVFTINELYWQPFSIFHYLPGEIAAADVRYYSDAASSFKIINDRGNFTLAGDSGNLTGWDTSNVRRYLSYFTSIPFESWAFDLTDRERDSIRSDNPFCEITITLQDSIRRTLALWEKFKKSDSIMVMDTDRAYGQMDRMEELIIVRYFDIDPVLKRRSYFFRE
jgi:hypothetical protein